MKNMLEIFALIALIVIIFISSNTIERTLKETSKQNEEIISLLKDIKNNQN